MHSKHEIHTLVEIVQIGPNGELRTRWRLLELRCLHPYKAVIWQSTFTSTLLDKWL